MRPGHQDPRGPGADISLCLFRTRVFRKICVFWLVLLPAAGKAQTLSLTRPNDMLAEDPVAFARWLDEARPAPVSAEEKTRVLASLPREGEVTELQIADRTKLAHLMGVLQALHRESVYVVKVIE